MANGTTRTFTLTAFASLERHKHAFFLLFFFLYVITMFLNVLLMTVVQQNKRLQQPMNVFASMLCCNEILGSSVLLLPLMRMLLSGTYKISIPACLTQVYFLHTYASAEFCILALMGYDRFVAICHPLHYHSIMTPSKVGRLIAVVGLYPFVGFACYFTTTLRLSFCGKVIPKLYCVNMEVVKNACLIPSYISSLGLIFLVLMVGPQLLLVIFSYVQILRVAKKVSKDSQVSGLKTCMPHLCSFFNYTIASLFEIVQNRFDMSNVAIEVRMFLSIYFAIIPPVANPVLYGLGTSLVRVHLMKICIKHKIIPSNVAKRLTVTSNKS